MCRAIIIISSPILNVPVMLGCLPKDNSSVRIKVNLAFRNEESDFTWWVHWQKKRKKEKYGSTWMTRSMLYTTREACVNVVLGLSSINFNYWPFGKSSLGYFVELRFTKIILLTYKVFADAQSANTLNLWLDFVVLISSKIKLREK